MKTLPLDELLTKITPLPYHRALPGNDGLDDFPDLTVQSSLGLIATLPDETDPENQHNAAYLAHAANVLPELVQAFNPDHLTAWASHLEQTHPGIASDLRDMATAQRHALAKATTVPV